MYEVMHYGSFLGHGSHIEILPTQEIHALANSFVKIHFKLQFFLLVDNNNTCV